MTSNTVIVKHAIRFIERFHLLFIAAAVRVMARSEAAVQSFNIATRRSLVCAEDSVIILVSVELVHYELEVLIVLAAREFCKGLLWSCDLLPLWPKLDNLNRLR